MTEQEMIDKLKLTPEQSKAFKRMSKALNDFNNAGGQLIGNNDYQYAVNGKNVSAVKDSYLNTPKEGMSIGVGDVQAPSIHMSDPFIDSSPFIVLIK
jgi:hypothetical protein